MSSKRPPYRPGRLVSSSARFTEANIERGFWNTFSGYISKPLQSKKKMRRSNRDVNRLGRIARNPRVEETGLDMAALSNGETVQIYTADLDGASTKFVIPREIICKRSPTFRDAFNRVKSGNLQKEPWAISSWPRALLSQLEVTTNQTNLGVEMNTSFDSPADSSLVLTSVDQCVFSCFFCWLYNDSHLHLIDKNNPKPDWDSNDSATWDYMFLFDLYLFGEYVACQDFQHLVLEAVYTKSRSTSIPSPGLASPSDIQSVYDRFDRSDPLIRVLIHAKLNMKPPPLYVAPEDSQMVYDDYPPRFMADCFAQSQRQNEALECPRCGPIGDELKCDSDTHIGDDAEPNGGYKWCNFHSHQTSQERRSCPWYKRYL